MGCIWQPFNEQKGWKIQWWVLPCVGPSLLEVNCPGSSSWPAEEAHWNRGAHHQSSLSPLSQGTRYPPVRHNPLVMSGMENIWNSGSIMKPEDLYLPQISWYHFTCWIISLFLLMSFVYILLFEGKCVYVHMPAHMRVHVPVCLWFTLRGQKRMSEDLELELQVVDSILM